VKPSSISKVELAEPEYSSSTVYVGGKGRLPDSDENNSCKFPFSDGKMDTWSLPWRKGGPSLSELEFNIHLSFLPFSPFHYVTIDEGITRTGNWWFEGLGKLKEVSLPSTLESTGEGTFAGGGFPKIDIPDKVKSIGSRAFRNCYSLKSIKIPANCALGDEVFNGSGLESVIINNLSSI
jgi:hypothetical protein